MSMNRGSNYSLPVLYRRGGPEEVSSDGHFDREIKKGSGKECASKKRELAEDTVYSSKEYLLIDSYRQEELNP